MCLFSVIIPNYNRAHLIEETIQLVLSQEFQDYEIIVIDDGSTDNTMEVLKPYQQNLKVIQQENKGPGAARNLGIKNAVGRYIAFLDSDDHWFSWTLSNFEKIIRQWEEPSFICGAYIYLEIGESVTSQNISTPLATYYQDFYSCPGIPFYSFTTSSVVVKTEVLKEVGGFSEKKSNYEDMDLYLRLGIAPGFVYIQSPPSAIKRKHNSNICFSQIHNRRGTQLIIDSEKEGHYPGGVDRYKERKEKICGLLRAASLTFVREGKIRDAILVYIQTFYWQLESGRFRYLLGLPLMALGKVVNINK